MVKKSVSKEVSYITEFNAFTDHLTSLAAGRRRRRFTRLKEDICVLAMKMLKTFVKVGFTLYFTPDERTQTSFFGPIFLKTRPSSLTYFS